jgi:hypothetical protein
VVFAGEWGGNNPARPVGRAADGIKEENVLFPVLQRSSLAFVWAGVILLTLAVLPTFGQGPTESAPQPAFGPAEECTCDALSCAGAGAWLTPPMLGDLEDGCVRGRATPVQGFKIGENESPRPLDRVFTAFNYYGDERPAATRAAGFGRSDIYRELFGLEKTFLDGRASVGLRLPLDTWHLSDGTLPGGTSTDIGDLDVIFKYALLEDRASGSLLSAGLVVTTPTGPSFFANLRLPDLVGAHPDTLLQPFVGYIVGLDKWYLHGFSSVSVSTDGKSAMLLFNDLGAGYWLYRNGGDALLTAVIPTAEVHVNTPLTHRDNPTVDSVDLTQGLIFEFRRRAWLTFGVSENVTGPKIYEIEAIVQLNLRF